jgi:hypothetical protein
MHPLFEKYGLKHLSISQVKTIKRSPFAWICEKVLGRRSPPTEATAFGSFIHDNFELLLAQKAETVKDVFISEEAKEFHVIAWNDKLFRFWEMYREQCKEWPEKDGIEAEIDFVLDDQLPHFIGKCDVVIRDADELWIQDHKTVGSKRYAYATPEDLATDPQLNLYAYALRNGEASVKLQHNQLFKKIKRKSVNVLAADTTWKDVDKAIELIRNDALEAIKILEMYDELGIEEFAYAVKDQYVETRWDFGGCPHWDFHQECLQKRLDKKRAISYDKGNKGDDTMPEDLHALVGKARDHFTAEGLMKFDLADAIVDAVMQNLIEKQVSGVFVRDGEGGDLVYNQLLNRVAEKNIAIFKKVR